MMASTHAAIGVVTYAGACALCGWQPTGLSLGLAAVGAWLPDADTPRSKAGLCLYPLARFLERRFGHRTVTHSVLGTLAFALLISPLLLVRGVPPLVFSALLTGYFSHLLADAATKSGVPLAWPNRARWVFPGAEQYRVRTGSRAELGVLAVVLMVGALTVPVQQHGVRRLLHLATGNLSGATRDVEDYRGWAVSAELEGYDVLTQQVIKGTYPVIGRRNDGDLIISREGARYLVTEGAGDIYTIKPRRIRIRTQRRLLTRTIVLQAQNITIGELSDRLRRAADRAPEPWTVPASHAWRFSDILVTGRGECYPSASPPVEVPTLGVKAVSFAGTRVAFDFATIPDLDIGPGVSNADVVIKQAALTLTLPIDVPTPDFVCPSRRAEVSARAMRRHADLLCAEGEVVRANVPLCRTFAQQIEHEPTPAERQSQTEAHVAARELRALEVEEAAMRRTRLWPQLRDGFAARRRSLRRAASWTMPVPPRAPAPAPARAPFTALVERVEWEPPTVPSEPGEKPEHAARLSLVEVNR